MTVMNMVYALNMEYVFVKNVSMQPIFAQIVNLATMGILAVITNVLVEIPKMS